jgi:eukaryotic-like serine/threonine-protein kinase
LIGRTIGNYVVQRQVGQGGMGIVYLAEHPRIKKQVAIKVLLPEYCDDPTVVARFFNEAKAANEIHSDHIIDIIDFGELEDHSSYIIMEWLDGVSLADALGDDTKLSLPRAVHIARGIGRALAGAHARGIVHRDLKPDNIFLITHEDDVDFVKVLDFGIAKLIKSDPATEIKTQTGAIIGTPSFMSPEQCRGMPIDQRTDIYALGCIVHRMLSGQLPFAAQALGELLLQHMTLPPTPLRQLDPEIPEYVEAAVLRALQKDPELRFQQVEDFMAALSEVKTGGFQAVESTDRRKPGMTANVPGRQTQPNMDTIGAATGQAISPTMSAPPKKRTPLFVFGALAVVIGFGATALVVTRKKTEVTPSANIAATQPPQPAPAPAPSPSPNPTPPVPPPTAIPAPIAPAVSKITLRTIPANAQVTLDDAKLQNPFEGSFPRSDARHRIEVKAPGYRTEAQWVTFDADRNLEIALVRGSGTHEAKVKLPAPPPTTAPPTVATPTTKPAETPKTKPDEKPVYKGTKGKLITEFPE